MLWTFKGLWLLYVLGMITGGGFMRWYVSEAGGRALIYGLTAVFAFLGALWLIVQWLGPVGG